ncbi:MAG: hypothetical protein V4695_01235 [Pseudomonadota bacterium]
MFNVDRRPGSPSSIGFQTPASLQDENSSTTGNHAGTRIVPRGSYYGANAHAAGRLKKPSVQNTAARGTPGQSIMVANPLNAEILGRFATGIVNQESVRKFTTACIAGRNSTVKDAHGCVQALTNAGIAADVFIYNALITKLGRNRRPGKAKDLLATMREEGVTPDVVTYSALISACEKAGLADQALQIFDDMRVEGVAPNIFTYSALISACEKAGWAEQALIVFDDMLQHDVAPNVVAFNAVISACEKSGWSEQAFIVFQNMPRYDVRPNFITYSALISACEKGGMEQIFHIPYLLHTMVEDGLLQPSLGYRSDRDTLDFHQHCLLTPSDEKPYVGGVNTAVAKAIFYHHAANGHLSPGTAFIVGQHGSDAVKSTIAQCMRDLGWIPVYGTTLDGLTNHGCLRAQIPGWLYPEFSHV